MSLEENKGTETSPNPEILKGKHVLVVDDDADVASFISAVLTRYGHAKVEICSSGQEALKKWKKNHAIWL